MKLLGKPVVLQNTEAGWLVSCEDIVTTNTGETVSFTTFVPRGKLTIGEMQIQAAEKAIALLTQFRDVAKKP